MAGTCRFMPPWVRPEKALEEDDRGLWEAGLLVEGTEGARLGARWQ